MFRKVDWNFFLTCVFRTEVSLDNVATQARGNKPFVIHLAREYLTKNDPSMYAIDTNDQLEIELPLIISGSDIIIL